MEMIREAGGGGRIHGKSCDVHNQGRRGLSRRTACGDLAEIPWRAQHRFRGAKAASGTYMHGAGSVKWPWPLILDAPGGLGCERL